MVKNVQCFIEMGPADVLFVIICKIVASVVVTDTLRLVFHKHYLE